MEPAIDFHFLLRSCIFAESAVETGKGIMRLRVGRVEPGGSPKLVDCRVRMSHLLKNVSQFEMRRGDIRVQLNRFAQLRFRLGQTAEEMKRDREIEIWPRRRVRKTAVQIDCF